MKIDNRHLIPRRQIVEITVPNEVGLRLARADQELVLLQRKVRNYLKGIPYSSGFEADPKRSDRRRIFVRVKKPVPEDIPICLSECVHQWRAALDNYAYIISRRHSGHTTGSEFPIFLNAGDYHRVTRSGVPDRRSGVYKVRGMKSGAQAIIEALQPYHGGQMSDPLWTLHELSNADKHRLLNTCGSVLEGSTYTIRHLDPGAAILKVRFIFGPVKDNATIGYMYVRKTDPDAKMTVTFKLTYRVAFEDHTNDKGQPLPTNGQLINKTTTLVRDAVWTACGRLSRYAGRTGVTRIKSLPLPPP